MRFEFLPLFYFLRFQFLVKRNSEHSCLGNANLRGKTRRRQQQNRSESDYTHAAILSHFGCITKCSQFSRPGWPGPSIPMPVWAASMREVCCPVVNLLAGRSEGPPG